ncbi:hypothetical protein [Amycolatopsis taiwanensis]|uniref:Uncharacterized protein n=1 Tax=Amycolatopsis taiwanensis TaxID=342230 RepID=A0A9W6RC02_9PSEU|nr:hypothetical protein [Amycolatopsis taiwanensis]GLY71155.1 hypothetical protein Atai01_77740 [Amycolatopsis taiwanensis]
MANDRRESYTRDGIEEMKWGLVRATIDRDVWDSVRGEGAMRCFAGSPDEGYRISFDHDAILHDREQEPGYEPPTWMTHHRLPPVPQKRNEITDRTAYVEDYQGNRTSETFDVWADPPNSGTFEVQGLYRKWANRVDEVFTGWDQVDHMPYEKNFWQAAGRLRDAIKPLETMSVPGEPYYAACRSLGLVEHDPGAQGTTPPERMWAPQINGPIDRFVIPLQGTFLNLFVLGELLAAQLDGMGKMWQNARLSVMEIGWYATKKMSRDAGRIDVQAIIKSAGWVVGAMGLIAMPTPASIGLAATGIILASADAILEEIKNGGKDVLDLEVAIQGGSAEEILRSTESALNSDRTSGLEPQIEIDEADSIDMLGVARSHLDNDQAVYDVAAKTYKTCFTMEVSDVQEDTAPNTKQDVDISVEFERLRDAGKTFADELGQELQGVSRGVQDTFSTSSAWERPELPGGVAIGIGLTGPWENWSPVRDHLVRILDTTATQVVEVGEYLISAANYLERQDASAKEAMEKASQELDKVFK